MTLNKTIEDSANAELNGWLQITEASRYRWIEDACTRLNRNGSLYYTGGKDGIYIRISPDGLLTAGEYSGAYPHIGEAGFKTTVKRKFANYNEALTYAIEAGGKQFLADMFTRM